VLKLGELVLETSFLLAEYVIILSNFGVDSQVGVDFLARHQKNKDFVNQAKFVYNIKKRDKNGERN
jgi:hypothetical protein